MKNWIFPLSLLVIFEALADIIAKKFAITHKPIIAIGALAVYLIANIFWLIALKNGAELSRGAILFSLFSYLLAIIIGVGFYKEHLSLIQGIGVCLGVVSLVMIMWE
jgi:multidrug transporter EmrE-like cation transporter